MLTQMVKKVRSIFRRHRLLLLFTTVLLLVFYHLSSPELLYSVSDRISSSIYESANRKAIGSYEVFFRNLDKYAPKSTSLKMNYKTERSYEKFYTTDFMFGKEYLENVLDISDEGFDELKQLHSDFVNQELDNIVDNVGLESFSNLTSASPKWDAYKGSAGYLLIGGGKFSWLSYLVIRQLRQIGSILPIELFIPTQQEYEEKFCNMIFDKYNARCNVIDESLTNSTTSEHYKISGYQYKMLAILSSTFENVLYIDSDNYPTRNPDYLFGSDIYNQTGMIMWPDFWARTTNPKFYDIAGVNVTEKKVRYNPYDKQQKQDTKPLSEFTFKDATFHTFEGALLDRTCETGMLMINKTSHMKTMLLALYYNVFGPDYYYPLHTQGSAGEGDKETFIAAAHVLNQPYFLTQAGPNWVGYNNVELKEFTAKALNHYDPVQSLDPTVAKDDMKTLFLHLSYPKFYIEVLYENSDLVYKESKDHIRMYKGTYKNVGYDFDLRVLQAFTQAACPNYYNKDSGKSIDGEGIDASEYMGDFLSYVKNDEERNTKRCEEVFIPHLKWLKETTEFGI